MLMLSRGVEIDFENNLAVVDSTEAAVPEDHFPETETDSEPVQESTQADIQPDDEQPQDVTYSFAVLFALGIIVGLLFFSVFSRRWD